MYLVAVLFEKFDKNKIDSLYLDEWFSQYIGMLYFLLFYYIKLIF